MARSTRATQARHGPSSRLAQLVERKTLNLVVVGSSPTVGAPALFFHFFFSNLFLKRIFRAALADPNRGWMAERSKALVLGTSLFGGVGSNPTPINPTLFWRASPLV